MNIMKQKIKAAPSTVILSLRLFWRSAGLSLSIILLFCIANAYAANKENNGLLSDNKNCLKFSSGLEVNHAKEYLYYLGYHTKRDMEFYATPIFSSAYDLNDDGNLEYFYYVFTPSRCGMYQWCTVRLYKYVHGKFHYMVNYHEISIIDFHHNFDPEKQVFSSDYICILDKKDFGWKRFIVKFTGMYAFDGKKYRLLKRWIDMSSFEQNQ